MLLAVTNICANQKKNRYQAAYHTQLMSSLVMALGDDLSIKLNSVKSSLVHPYPFANRFEAKWNIYLQTGKLQTAFFFIFSECKHIWNLFDAQIFSQHCFLMLLLFVIGHHFLPSANGKRAQIKTNGRQIFACTYITNWNFIINWITMVIASCCGHSFCLAQGSTAVRIFILKKWTSFKK